MQVNFAQLKEAGVRLAPRFVPGDENRPVWVDAHIGDLSQPAAIVDAVTKCVGGMPPGWSLFDVEFSFTSGRLRCRFEPLLERQLVERTQKATAARRRAEDAIAEAESDELAAASALAKLLARGNREKSQPTINVVGVEIDCP